MNQDFIYRQIMKLSDYRMANHSRKGQTHDLSQEKDGHNRIDLLRFHVIQILPKGKSLNSIHYIKYIQQSILELHPESIRRRLVIHADNVNSDTARQSQEFCVQNSLRITTNLFYSNDLAP
jgi:hypothetical protein